ncbi:Up-regulated during septation-domain-containing protein [Whalleya microplaca]|nr:Up-regulated during septation-domain-containing protein [Whalleya microplaca]
MQNTESRKYQLFPTSKGLAPVTAGKQLDPEQAFAMVMGQSPEKTEKSSIPSGLRMRIKEHNLTRRRKVSVPDLGPMTTVQEVAMDSPTIPGRPALHERSISSPANSSRQQHIAESLVWDKESLDQTPEVVINNRPLDMQNHALSSKPSLSPKSLAPLTIPSQVGTIPWLAHQSSSSRLRSVTTPQESASQFARSEESPMTRGPSTPYTSASSSVSSATTMSTLPTPLSAPAESRASPRPWEKSTTTAQNTKLDPLSTPKSSVEKRQQYSPAMSHRRGQSESASIMERGRPRKRIDGTSIGCTLKRTPSKRSISDDRRAFETLPSGWKPNEAAKNLDQIEVTYLQKQALGQALRFEMLRKDDVDCLSKELRHLDDRTEYLRRTYTSLRAGRRNLHSRICQYLRSPRVAKFSYESMLKQEETLAELDASIDDWVTKLEHAENRRTRVRQKLLEHVAAAVTLNVHDVASVNETLHQTMGVRFPGGASEISTPPRSPIKENSYYAHSPSSSPLPSPSTSPSPASSPQRVVARVPSVIPELPAEETEDNCVHGTQKSCKTDSMLQRMESIRIYADSDVYALLADVESEFTKLNGGGTTSPEPAGRHVSDEHQRVLHRAHSHDVLSSGGQSKLLNKTPPMSPPAPSPPMKNSPTKDGDFFLSAAVFQPVST